MAKKNKRNISKEMEQFHCSILLEEVKEKVRKLKEYGMDDSEILAAMVEEEQLPQLIVTKGYKVVLAGEQPVEVEMEPLVKAVYLLFLKHPEGILFKHLPDYREELIGIYAKLRPLGMSERAIQSIEDVTNPLLNSINEKCARIRGAFLSQFDDRMARHYYIDGPRGEAKKISLPRDLVIWE
jgi:hypothetical protein